MDGGASQSSGRADAPITPEMLADLQAGLLDDATAARVRRRARTDPEAARQLAALDRVRRDLAELAADEASAADVPAAVTARVGAALQAVPLKREVPPAPPGHHVLGGTGRRAAAHAVRGSLPQSRRLRRLCALAGLFAAVVAVGLGAVMLIRPQLSATSTQPTAEHITVSPPPRDIPLSDPQIVGLLADRPDYGPLTDPQRRASCLNGLGYPAATKVLGARPVDMQGRPAVLMVLPGDTPKALVALVVEANCSSADSGLLADTVVRRP